MATSEGRIERGLSKGRRSGLDSMREDLFGGCSAAGHIWFDTTVADWEEWMDRGREEGEMVEAS